MNVMICNLINGFVLCVDKYHNFMIVREKENFMYLSEIKRSLEDKKFIGVWVYEIEFLPNKYEYIEAYHHALKYINLL